MYKVSSRENPQHAEQSYALRCFKHLAQDLAKRYAKISSHLGISAPKSEFLLGTRYHEEGIRIEIGMEARHHDAVGEGEFLDVYFDSAKEHPYEMAWLVNRLERLAGELHKAGMAHGDLHHKNILITRHKNRRLLLIDYDGMYVPALKGEISNETGMKDYQHPGRDWRHFHAGLDRFALAVLYLNAVAVQRHPELWDAKTRTDGLLTEARDYASPDESETLDQMAQFPDLRSAVIKFRRLCLGDIDELPEARQFFETFSDEPPVAVVVPTRVPVSSDGGVRSSRAGAVPASSARPVLGTTLRELRALAGEEVTVIGQYARFEKGDGTAASAFRTLFLESSGGATFEIIVEQEVARQFTTTGRPWSVKRSDWIAVTGVLLNDERRFVIDLEQAADLQKLTSAGARRRLRHGPNDESGPRYGAWGCRGAQSSLGQRLIQRRRTRR